jgi:hypothetical protein
MKHQIVVATPILSAFFIYIFVIICTEPATEGFPIKLPVVYTHKFIIHVKLLQFQRLNLLQNKAW